MDDLFADEAARRAAHKEESEARERRFCNALAALAATDDGLRFIRWLIGQSDMLISAYPSDHAQAAYREGKRSVGAQLLALAARAGVLPEILKEESHG